MLAPALETCFACWATSIVHNHQASHKHRELQTLLFPGACGLSWSPKLGCGKEPCFFLCPNLEVSAAWARPPALPLTNCVTLGESLKPLPVLLSSCEWGILYLIADDRNKYIALAPQVSKWSLHSGHTHTRITSPPPPSSMAWALKRGC